jgi:hypothetical protein
MDAKQAMLAPMRLSRIKDKFEVEIFPITFKK